MTELMSYGFFSSSVTSSLSLDGFSYFFLEIFVNQTYAIFCIFLHPGFAEKENLPFRWRIREACIRRQPLDFSSLYWVGV